MEWDNLLVVNRDSYLYDMQVEEGQGGKLIVEHVEVNSMEAGLVIT